MWTTLLARAWKPTWSWLLGATSWSSAPVGENTCVCGTAGVSRGWGTGKEASVCPAALCGVAHLHAHFGARVRVPVDDCQALKVHLLRQAPGVAAVGKADQVC